MIIFIKKTRCKITWNTATKSFTDLINKLPSLPLFVDYTQISDDDEPLRLLATYSNRFREQLVPAQDHSVIQIKGQNSVTPQQKFTCDQTKHYWFISTWNNWAIKSELFRTWCWKAAASTADPSGFKRTSLPEPLNFQTSHISINLLKQSKYPKIIKEFRYHSFNPTAYIEIKFVTTKWCNLIDLAITIAKIKSCTWTTLGYNVSVRITK